jgi:hypothetical protein
MLRIIRTETAAERRWVLCGQLAGRWVQEFRSQWLEFAASKPLPIRDVVDLTDVTFIDEEGEALLAQFRRDGIDFIAGAGVDNRDLLENLCTNERRPVRRILGRTNESC